MNDNPAHKAMHIKQTHISNPQPNLLKEYVSPTHGLTEIKNNETPTHGIVHASFGGMRTFVARKKRRCKLIGFRLVIPHDTIPSPLGNMPKDQAHK
ncbi:MAG: hypothetical protein FD155_3286 [Bacteroidetes bacterium]|nr:MAG: hypothetical protein FD155_3286 [Bacteroidota bacterium]